MAAPQSQKAESRPISFVLDDGRLPPVALDLYVRPEDLRRTDSSRVSVQQSLGGAWVDSFGRGVPQITISGHTGWRRGKDQEQLDGIERFQKLKEQVFDGWHKRRQAELEAGRDPDAVQLIFADALDDFAVAVVPGSFMLQRSKSSPLLCRYQLSMTVVDPYVDQAAADGVASGTGASKKLSALDSLKGSIAKIKAGVQAVKRWISTNILGPIKAVVALSAAVFSLVHEGISTVRGIADSVIEVAHAVAQAGSNLFRTLAALQDLPDMARADMMSIAGAFTNVRCVLRNALKSDPVYPDYSSLYGASHCSSTSGGRPLSPFAGSNTFEAVTPNDGAAPVSVTPEGWASLQALAKADPVLAPQSTVELQAHAQAVAAGMTVAA